MEMSSPQHTCRPFPGPRLAPTGPSQPQAHSSRPGASFSGVQESEPPPHGRAEEDREEGREEEKKRFSDHECSYVTECTWMGMKKKSKANTT